MPTYYVQIVRNPAEFRVDDWTPWLNGKSHEDTAMLAAHKWIRDSGYSGLRQAEPFDPVTITVYVASSDSPRHPNGRFMTCQSYELRVFPTAGKPGNNSENSVKIP